jgi:hypothetical protein
MAGNRQGLILLGTLMVILGVLVMVVPKAMG